jgi:uncharacterized membrane protein
VTFTDYINSQQLNFANIVFIFFILSFTGWVGECIMESSVRRRFVNKGFFTGPWVPLHGIGGIIVYMLLFPVKKYPLLVFSGGVVITTAVEYITALFLEKVFNKKCWDYDTYPYSKWCNYKKRVALTTSLFFGVVVFALLYFYWDLCLRIIDIAGHRLIVLMDIILAAIFITDAVFTIKKYIRNKRAGIANKTDGIL